MIARTHRLVVLIAAALACVGCGTGAIAVAGPTTPVVTTPTVRMTTAPSSPPSSTASTPTVPPSAPPSPTIAAIARLSSAVAADPSDEGAQRDLGFALLQRVRETADPTLYPPAAAAFEAARRLAPDDALVFVGIGGLELGKHGFADALVTGRQAVALSPNLPSARAIVVDALVELGRYDEAGTASQAMLGIAADLPTLARVSYLAELRGDLDVALSAMRMAASSPGLAPENVAYVDVLLGNLFVYRGDPSGAADAYREALALVPAYAPALAGQGRLAVGAGRLDEAIDLFQRAAAILPLPEYVIALADAQTAAGRTDDASRNVKLARAEIQLFQATGVVVDLDLALFEADHGDPARALAFARAAYAATPTMRAADALGWALHRLGRDREAGQHAVEALRLGSRDPLFRYHAGAIEAALGHVDDARRDLEQALATDPGFSSTGAAEVRRLLATLPH